MRVARYYQELPVELSWHKHLHKLDLKNIRAVTIVRKATVTIDILVFQW